MSSIPSTSSRHSRLAGAAVSAALAVLLLIASSVAAPGAEAAQGEFEVRLKDHRAAIGDFAELTIRLAALRLRRTSGIRFWRSRWVDHQPTVSAVDLTRYVGGRSVAIFRKALEPGMIEGVHLQLAGISGRLTNGDAASVSNEVHPISLRVEVGGNVETVLLLDVVVLDVGDHPGKGYEMHVKGFELYRNGRLLQRVPPG